MTEYIQRESLQKSMELVTNDITCPLHIAAEIDQIISQEPTVDAVEVVRCRECTHWDDESKKMCPEVGHALRPRYSAKCKRLSSMYITHYRSEKDFCSCGERRESKDE